MIKFTVHCKPIAQGSMQARTLPNGKTIMFHPKNKELMAFREVVGLQARAATKRVYEGPVVVFADFYLQPGKTVTRQLPSIKPDLDKYARALLDALTGVLFNDDSQVVDLYVRKRYAPEQRVVITVAEVTKCAVAGCDAAVSTTNDAFSFCTDHAVL